MTQSKNTNNNGLLKIAVVLLLVFVLLLGGALCWFLFLKPDSDDDAIKGGQRESEALQGTIQRMSDEEIQAALDKVVEEGMFRISIASNIIAMEGGKAELRIENNPDNRYVMQVSIFLDETGEEIYSTDLIDPGYYIQEAALDKYLLPGEYEVTAVFTAYYPDSADIVGRAGAQVMLYVVDDPAVTPPPTPTPGPAAEK